MNHECHAIGCDHPTPVSMLMCRRCWFSVPPSLRKEVWRHYRPGQERDRDVSPGYARAARAAVIELARLEGKVVTGDEPEVRLYDQFLEE